VNGAADFPSVVPTEQLVRFYDGWKIIASKAFMCRKREGQNAGGFRVNDAWFSHQQMNDLEA